MFDLPCGAGESSELDPEIAVRFSTRPAALLANAVRGERHSRERDPLAMHRRDILPPSGGAGWRAQGLDGSIHLEMRTLAEEVADSAAGVLAPPGGRGSDALLHCKTNQGKTLADVQAWLDGWRVLAKKNGIEYRVRLLLPHADSQLAADEFFIERGSPTLQSYAKAWDWWYTDAAARASNTQLTAATTCDSGAVYRSTD